MLKVEDIHTFYGTAQALFGVNLEINSGEVLALMGRNGMGKTTTIRSICRMTPHASGSIHFHGKDLRTLPAFKVARLGIGLVPEGRRCFTNLSVWENLAVTAQPGAWNMERVLILFPRLGERLGQSARTLSGGEQQMLAIGRALMTNPTLLILDEATEGLAPVIRQEIWAAVKQLKLEGLSILIVDKTLSELLPVADRCVVLEKGRTVWSGEPQSLNTDIRDRYLGIS